MKTKKLKLILLYIFRGIGLFKLTKYLTRNGLRILCYHNFGKDDVVSFSPKLFIRLGTFSSRINLLQDQKFPILNLNDAVRLLEQKRLPDSATVITIDDGWHSTKQFAYPVLREKCFPFTVYLTSYYSQKETPVFSLVVQFMFWKTSKHLINLDELGLPFAGVVSITDREEKEEVMSKIIEYGQNKLKNPERCILAERLGTSLNVSYSEIENSRIFSLLNASEIKELSLDGVDFQLHTHRHEWPLNGSLAVRELLENSAFLASLVGNKIEHFCYPSGFWISEQFTYLKSQGIKSATTCESGFNYSHTDRMKLNRFLDSESISHIEFEAEMFGFLEIMRKVRKIFRLT